MSRFPVIFAAFAALAGCAVAPPPSPAAEADASACTAQADAAYNAQNYEALSRPSQTGLIYSATPNHVFDAQNLGALHQRDSAITDCEQNGAIAGAPATGVAASGTFLTAAPVAPQIVTPP